MTEATDTPWTYLEPPLPSKASQHAFVTHARALAKVRPDERTDEALEKLRATFVAAVQASRRADRQALLAIGLLVGDLATQGWKIRVRGERVGIRPPEPVTDMAAEKARIRQQELVKRNAQLRKASVQRFLNSMERQQLRNGQYVSIYSLMRDGRELAEGLREARTHLNNGWADALSQLVDPYLEFVISEDATCAHTGLRLMDVWRYFRHTWTNQYTSVPGRTMMFLVRDRAAANHPVMGIGALSSPVMQIRERDSWIGWHADTFLERVRRQPTRELAKWLVSTLDSAIDEVYVADLLEDKVLSTRDLATPSEAALERLLKEGAEQRRLHHRYARSRDLKRKRDLAGDEYWVARARTHLFRSKRALALATYLRARAVLNDAFEGKPTAEKLAALAATGYGSEAIRRVLKKAKADRVGIAVADITVCGAVQPYNALLGGKLTAMFAASPEVAQHYRRRYARAESEIASSVAGRPIVRASKLVLLGTTSLYGVGSSQYNRIKIPAEPLGGATGDVIRYEELGRSEAFGTSQYSEQTVDALVNLVQQSDAQRVNSIFGEGVSPKLRKVRHALDLLSLPCGMFLRHHRPRVVYAVSLIKNLADYLIGLAKQPDYIVPAKEGPGTTAAIGAWWRERWLRHRIKSDEVLAEVARHTRVRPVTHGARVPGQRALAQHAMFADLS
jgi:hypothetical protein